MTAATVTVNSYIIHMTSWERWIVVGETFTTPDVETVFNILKTLGIPEEEYTTPGGNHYEYDPIDKDITINLFTWCNDRNAEKQAVKAEKLFQKFITPLTQTV